jgi:tetratricopeptide (TPR) repeat protein
MVSTIAAMLLLASAAGRAGASVAAPPAQGYAGSLSCRECHEKFHDLLSRSWHGITLRPYTDGLASRELAPQADDLAVAGLHYRAAVGPGEGFVAENAPDGAARRYPIAYVLGGKNVCYFLAELERGRLQTLPVAYDVRRKEWFDTAASGVRHVPGQPAEEPVGWKEWPYTFNTSCYGCHVSQLSTGYDLGTDTYRTTWKEPGINCETCHGPSEEHNRAARATPKGQSLSDPKIIRAKAFTPAQHNSSCLSCHAKASPLTASYPPGEPFFDHFDLATLENPDFYPDGRDLGENYTMTSWLLSPCARKGQLHCLTCHTSSGRYRFGKPGDADEACLPCHAERVKNAAAHTRHGPESPGSRCVACHMPSTEFARMRRSDHSMRPPAPAATLAFGSPNACNGCHADRDAAWADGLVRSWHARDYQAPVLRRGELVAAARRRDWSRLPEMLVAIAGEHRDEVFAASLSRLLAPCPDSRKNPALLAAVKDPSPLVRAAAAEALGTVRSPEAGKALLAAAGDASRLVRTRAAAALAGASQDGLTAGERNRLERADAEHLASLTARPDQWTSHYNVGNYRTARGELREAFAAYDTALRLEPRAAMAMVNAATASARLGEPEKAEENLRRALAVAPENAAAHFNLGLLLAEKNDAKGAEAALRTALKHDSQLAPAAYNLCVLLAGERPAEALPFCQQAAELQPGEARYAYALAFYEEQAGNKKEAVKVLERLVGSEAGNADAVLLLGALYEGEKRQGDAATVYRRALAAEGLPERMRRQIAGSLDALEGRAR